MNFGIIIIGIILVIIGVVPVILINNNYKKGEKKSMKALNDLAAKSNCTITQFDLLNKRTIGIDRINRKLFFIKSFSSQNVEREIDLSKIKKCQIINTSRTVKNKDGNYKITEKIELEFTNIDNAKRAAQIEWFDVANDNFMLSNDYQLIEKWEKLINTYLKEQGPKLVSNF